MTTKKQQTQKECNHPSWLPVSGEMGAYQCPECEVYGRRVSIRDTNGKLKETSMVPWADGLLHPASSHARMPRKEPRKKR